MRGWRSREFYVAVMIERQHWVVNPEGSTSQKVWFFTWVSARLCDATLLIFTIALFGDMEFVPDGKTYDD